jgi:hypothetical protein
MAVFDESIVGEGVLHVQQRRQGVEEKRAVAVVSGGVDRGMSRCDRDSRVQSKSSSLSKEQIQQAPVRGKVAHQENHRHSKQPRIAVARHKDWAEGSAVQAPPTFI